MSVWIAKLTEEIEIARTVEWILMALPASLAPAQCIIVTWIACSRWIPLQRVSLDSFHAAFRFHARDPKASANNQIIAACWLWLCKISSGALVSSRFGLFASNWVTKWSIMERIRWVNNGTVQSGRKESSAINLFMLRVSVWCGGCWMVGEKKWMIHHPKGALKNTSYMWWRHLNEIEQHVAWTLYVLRASAQLMASGACRSRACREYFIPWKPVGDNSPSHLRRHKASMFICLLGLSLFTQSTSSPRVEHKKLSSNWHRHATLQANIPFRFCLRHTTESKLFLDDSFLSLFAAAPKSSLILFPLIFWMESERKAIFICLNVRELLTSWT